MEGKRPLCKMFSVVRKLSDREFEEMIRSLHHYTCNNRFPSMFFLNTEQLKSIPKEVMVALMPEDIPLVWNRLPEDVREDLHGYQRCVEHTTSSGGDVGPIVLIKDCVYCLKKL